jgi:opacity protein-like surface antigen
MVTASMAGLGLAAQAALAADVVPEPVCVWCGFHIGVGGGIGFNTYDVEDQANLDFVFDEDVDGPGPIEPGDVITLLRKDNDADLGESYGFFTIEAGFDFQFADSPFVLGILGSYDFNGDNGAETEDSLTVLPENEIIGNPDVAKLTHQAKADIDDSWFLGARAGFAVMNNSALLYVLGGYTWVNGHLESEHSLDILESEAHYSFDEDADDSVDGWTLGGGVEAMLWESVSLKLEYRHDFLDDVDFDESEEVADFGDFGHLDVNREGSVDFERDTIRAVLSWRFNPWGSW